MPVLMSSSPIFLVVSFLLFLPGSPPCLWTFHPFHCLCSSTILIHISLTHLSSMSIVRFSTCVQQCLDAPPTDVHPVARYRLLTPKSRCVQTEDIDEREPLVSRERPLTEARLAQSKLRTRYRSCSPRRIEGRSISCIQRRTVWSQFERIFEARAPWILSTAQKHC